AHFLRENGVGPEVPVGICAERSPDMIVALLGILKAGGAYLPLDHAYPRERLQFLRDDTRPPVILTRSTVCSRLPDAKAIIHCLDMDWPQMIDFSCDNLDVEVSGENLTYLPYTSGSTGEPKGVAVVHRAIVRLICENNYAKFGPEEVFLHLAPL